MLRITGQQKIQLNKYEKGLIKASDLTNFVRGRVSELPYDLVKNASLDDIILYIIKNSIVYTNVHQSINRYANFPYNRLTHRSRLRASGIIH